MKTYKLMIINTITVEDDEDIRFSRLKFYNKVRDMKFDDFIKNIVEARLDISFSESDLHELLDWGRLNWNCRGVSVSAVREKEDDEEEEEE